MRLCFAAGVVRLPGRHRATYPSGQQLKATRYGRRAMTIHFAILDECPSAAQLEMARGLVREYAALPHTVGRWSIASADIAALPAPFVHPRVVAASAARLPAH
jgi:hypothetical protein